MASKVVKLIPIEACLRIEIDFILVKHLIV